MLNPVKGRSRYSSSFPCFTPRFSLGSRAEAAGVQCVSELHGSAVSCDGKINAKNEHTVQVSVELFLPLFMQSVHIPGIVCRLRFLTREMLRKPPNSQFCLEIWPEARCGSAGPRACVQGVCVRGASVRGRVQRGCRGTSASALSSSCKAAASWSLFLPVGP